MSPIVIAIARPKFQLGQIVITANARGTLDPADMQQGLSRHALGDWGDLVPERHPVQRGRPEARRPAVLGLRARRYAAFGSSPKPTGRSRPCCCRWIINQPGGYSPPTT